MRTRCVSRASMQWSVTSIASIASVTRVSIKLEDFAKEVENAKEVEKGSGGRRWTYMSSYIMMHA